MMASIRSQLDLLDAKMAELQQSVEPEESDIVPIDLDIADVMEVVPVPEPVEEPSAVELDIPEEDDDLPFEEEAAEPEPEPEPVSEPEPEPELEPEPEPEEIVEEPELAETEPDEIEDNEPESEEEEPVAVEDDDLPIFAEPEPVCQAAAQTPAAPKVKEAVIDAMAQRQAWRTDMPGTSVKDIRSAISLNDRIIFINYLFNEDPLAFQEALTRINVMTSLDSVVEYVMAEHPEWDLDSEIVYRFMMAVRRRIR